MSVLACGAAPQLGRGWDGPAAPSGLITGPPSPETNVEDDEAADHPASRD